MNRSDARDAIYTHGTAAWTAAIAAEDLPDGATVAIRYQGVARQPGTTDNQPAQGTYWVRLSMQTADEGQETLRNQVRRFHTVGFAYAQIFVPLTDGEAQVRLDRIADRMRDFFRDRAPADNLEFTSAKIDDNVPADPAWLCANVVSEFGYRQFL